MKTNFEFVTKELERAGFITCCRNAEKSYTDGKLKNGIFGFIQVLNEHESEIRLNAFGHLTVKIPNREIFNFIHQMSK